MIETQTSIAEWADQTFGKASHVNRILTRANLEMAELLHALTEDKPKDPPPAECADVAIVLSRGGRHFKCVNIYANIAAHEKKEVTKPKQAAWLHALHGFSVFTELLEHHTHFRQEQTQGYINSCLVHLDFVCRCYQTTLAREIDKRMKYNRAGTYTQDGTGHGNRVKAAAPA